MLLVLPSLKFIPPLSFWLLVPVPFIMLLKSIAEIEEGKTVWRRGTGNRKGLKIPSGFRCGFDCQLDLLRRNCVVSERRSLRSC